MLWIVAAIAAILIFFLVFVKTPMRRTLALTFAAAARFCRESHEAAGKLKEPQKSLIQAKIEIQWATLLYRQGRMGEAEDLFRRGFSHTQAAG